MKIPDFLIRFFAKKVAKKLDLQEGNMDGTKKWYKSKNVWTSVVAGLIGIYMSIAPVMSWPAIPEYVFSILAAIGIYTRVTATDKIG